jgi:hypothetical protein
MPATGNTRMLRTLCSALTRLAVVLAAALALSACPAGDQPVDDDLVEPGPTEPTEPGAPEDPAEAADPAEPADPAQPADPAEPDDEVEPLAGTPGTEEKRVDAAPGRLAVVGVRIGVHDGFDRVVLDLEGDGAAGWWVNYIDAARTAGRGDDIPLEGDAVLSVAVQGVTLPPELPPGIEPWMNDRRAAPDGGVITEVASDVVFEGVHGVFVGLDEERPFLIERFEDPQRLVIDLFHD